MKQNLNSLRAIGLGSMLIVLSIVACTSVNNGSTVTPLGTAGYKPELPEHPLEHLYKLQDGDGHGDDPKNGEGHNNACGGVAASTFIKSESDYVAPITAGSPMPPAVLLANEIPIISSAYGAVDIGSITYGVQTMAAIRSVDNNARTITFLSDSAKVLVVDATGQFTPDHIPCGAVRETYSYIRLFLDAVDGHLASALLSKTQISGTIPLVPLPTPMPTQIPTPATAPSIQGTFKVGNAPSDVAIDLDGNVWVPNLGDSTVTKLSPAGVVLGTYTVGSSPTSVAVDANGVIWVSEWAGLDVRRLDTNGNTLGSTSLGAEAQCVRSDHSGHMWVTTQLPAGVTKLGLDGTVLATYAMGANPQAIAFDSSDNAWITDGNATSVTKLGQDGTVLGTFPVGNNGWGIAFDAQANAYIACAGDSQIVELSPTGTHLNSFAAGNNPQPLLFTGNGNLWVADNYGANLTELSSVGAILNTLTPGPASYKLMARLVPPPPTAGLALGKDGALWLVNNSAGTVSKITAP